MNLLLIEESELDASGAVSLTGARAGHLRRVLNVMLGDQVRVGLLDGPRGQGIVTAISDDRIDLRCEFESIVPPRPVVDLLLALPRPKVLQRLWAQIAAIGVGQIILTNAERVERNYFDTHVLTPAAYRPLLIEGLQQARDTRLPAVSIHRQFRVLIEDLLDSLFPLGLRLVADPAAGSSRREEVRTQQGGRLLLAIGPEGGWNSFELTLLAAHGFRPISMGPRTLRTDTACVALLALASSRDA